MVSFPVIVLGVFAWLVAKHHEKLYSPADFRQDESFLQASRAYRAAAALGAASARMEAIGLDEDEVERSAAGAAEVLARATTRRPQSGTILWVDDRPDNNRFERRALEELGFKFVLATSTEEALERIRLHAFNAIISDMGRPPDSQAGYTLLDRLRADGNQVPFLIYAGSRAPEHVKQAQSHGAQGTTNRPDELVEMVLRVTAGAN